MTELDVKIGVLKGLVYSAMTDPAIRNLALNLTRGLRPQDKAKSIYLWVKRNVRFVPERHGRDIAYPPAVTVKMGHNDCEDHSTLVASLTRLVGLPTRFKVTSRDGIKYTHIFPQVNIGGQWISLDTTIPLPLGTEIPAYKSKVYAI